ncbi:hypothetical protein Ancab_009433 [Ancistrocladus abbreviatus]
MESIADQASTRICNMIDAGQDSNRVASDLSPANRVDTTGKSSKVLGKNSPEQSSEYVRRTVVMRACTKSDAAEDVVMLQKLRYGEASIGYEVCSGSICISDEVVILNKGLTGLQLDQDCILSVRGANDVNIEAVNCSRAHQNNASFSSVLLGNLVRDGVEAVDSSMSSGSVSMHCDSQEWQQKSLVHRRSSKALTHRSVSTSLLNQLPLEKLDLENPLLLNTDNGKSPQGSLSCFRREQMECKNDHYKPCFPGPAEPDVFSGRLSAAKDSANHRQDSKDNLLGKSPTASAVNFVEAERNDGDWSGNSLKCPEQDGQVNDCNGMMESADRAETPLPSSPAGEDDESDIEEQDVKVCDICGDAGREELLAICCRCSDGAEHTYCMREMLDKVPEGDWLCEECKLNEEIENQKHNDSEMLTGNERNRHVGRTSSVNVESSMKLACKDRCDASKTNNVSLNKQVLNKRPGDNAEVTPTAKRQAVEPCVGSSMISCPSRFTALSRDNSFKNLDRMKVKPDHQLSFGTNSINDTSVTAESPTTSSVHALKGTFVKSSSFSTCNPKPKVQLVDEIRQRQKQVIDSKDGIGKMIGKSLSFKGNWSRANASEAKVKMLSPKISPIQDYKGLKQSKECGSVERKNSIRLDHPLASQVQLNSSKHQSRGDGILFSSVNTSRDYKALQPEGKCSTTMRTSGHATHGIADVSASLGEVKRQPTLCPNISGSASITGLSSSAELKPNHVGLNDGTASGSQTGELDYECGISSTPWVSTVGPSDVRTSKEGINEDNKLKAAIEAAVRKRLHINQRNRAFEKSNELSVSNMDSACEMAPQDRLLVPNHSRILASAGGVNEGESVPKSFPYNSCKQAHSGSAKQLKVHPADSVPSPGMGDLCFAVSSNGEAVFRTSTIPEHDYIWQGGFEVDRNRRIPELCNGVQAHLSTFASYKVIEIVVKFPQKVVLRELPRSCVWPRQFQSSGAGEDNIAVYFFARDLESYEKSYKNLVENMMKDDLALKGNIDGIELLIFPSNQLPKKSQCWNMMFFLWGVFRGRKTNYLNDKLGSVEKLDISSFNVAPSDKDVLMPVPENTPLLWDPVNEDLSALGSQYNVVSGNEAAASMESSIQPSPSLSNGGCDINGNSLDQACLCRQTNKNHDDITLRANSSGFHELSCSSTSMSERSDPDSKIGTQVIDLCDASDVTGKTPGDQDIALAREGIAFHSLKMPVVCTKEAGSVGGFGKEQVMDLPKYYCGQLKLEHELKQEVGRLDTMNGNRGEVKLEEKLKQEGCVDIISNEKGAVKLEDDYLDMNVPSLPTSLIEDLKMDYLNRPQVIVKKLSHQDSTGSGEHATSTITSKNLTKNEVDALDDEDQQSMHKRVKAVVGMYGFDRSRYSGQLHGASTSSPVDDGCNKGHDKAAFSDLGSAERYLFPANIVQSCGNPLPWKVASREIDDRLPDGSPNLDLALGAEKKRPKSEDLPFFAGIVDEKKNQDKPPDAVKLEGEEDTSASLSLSLAFPFSDEERQARPVSDTEPVVLENRELSNSLLLFRSVLDK